MFDIVVKNAVVFAGGAFDQLHECDIAIADGRIAHIGSVQEPSRIVVNGTDQFVTPGFVNAHFHPSQQLNRAISVAHGHDHHMDLLHSSDRVKSEAQTTDLAYIAFLEALRSGTTAFQCVGSNIEVFMPCIEKMGLRACCVPILKDISDHTKGASVRAISHDTEECLQRSENLFDRYHSDLVRVHFGVVNVRYASDDLILGMKELSDRHTVGFHMHAAESTEYVEAVIDRTSRRPIEHLHSLNVLGSQVSLAHCVHLVPEEIEILAQTGTHVTHCPRANSYLGVGCCPVLDLLRARVNVALGTDAAINNNSNEVRAEARAARDKLADQYGHDGLIDHTSLFRMLTTAGAKALGLEDRIGSIEVGKRADMVLWKRTDLPFVPGFNLLSDLLFTDSCRAHSVIIDGRIVMANYKCQLVDEDAIIAQAIRAAHEYKSNIDDYNAAQRQNVTEYQNGK